MAEPFPLDTWTISCVQRGPFGCISLPLLTRCFSLTSYCGYSSYSNRLMRMSAMLLLDILFHYCEAMECENILYNNRTYLSQWWKTCLVPCWSPHFIFWKVAYCWVLMVLMNKMEYNWNKMFKCITTLILKTKLVNLHHIVRLTHFFLCNYFLLVRCYNRWRSRQGNTEVVYFTMRSWSIGWFYTNCQQFPQSKQEVPISVATK